MRMGRRDKRGHDWGAFLENGSWSLGGDEEWLNNPWRRRVAQQRALDWCDRRKLPSVYTLMRLCATLYVFTSGWVRWRIRRARSREQSRKIASEEFRRGAERLGATWIKLGQLIAAGEGVFPEELVTACRSLHDRVRSEPWDRVESVLERSFGTKWGELMVVETEPLAAASIAQTHKVKLKDGTEGVIKIQRDGVAKRVEHDVRALSLIAPLLVGRIPVAALANPPALIELFARCIGEELDFTVEATNACDVARVIKRYGAGGVVVPRPHPYLVEQEAMVMEYLPGRRIEEIDKRLGGKVMDTLAGLILEGALLGGVFHGDLHPGNMAVRDTGEVVLYDFGIVARLEEYETGAFLQLVAGSASGDWRRQLDALVALGALPADGDLEALGKELGLDKGPFDPSQLDADALAKETARIARTLLDAGAVLPKALMLWGKNLAFLDAAVGILCPERNLVELVGTSIGGFAKRHGSEVANKLGSALVVDEAAIAAGLAADGRTLRWSEMKERRNRIMQRQAARVGKTGRQ